DESAHGAETRQDQRVHAGLGAAGEDRVGVTTPDDLCAFADRRRPGGAGRDGRVVRPPQPERDRELPGRGVDEDVRQEVGRHAVGSPLAHDGRLLHDPEEAPDCRSEDDADPGRLVDAVEACVLDRLVARREREQHVPVELSHLLRRDDPVRVEVLDLGGDPDGEPVRVERADEVDAALAGDGGCPGGLRVVPDRRHGSEPGHDDASHDARVFVRKRAGTGDLRAGSSTAARMPVSVAERPGAKVPFPPMEAQLVRELPGGEGWQYEPKWDGFRGVLENDGGELALWSRNSRPLLRYFPELTPLGDRLPPSSALDGEIVIEHDGRLEFDLLQMRLHPPASRVNRLATETPSRFIAFDLLLWEGEPIWKLPLAERRARLL